MIKNYLKIAWRNLLNQKFFSLLNIFGLALGMTVCMLALIIVKNAYDYDRFHPGSENIYRILTEVHQNVNDKILYASSPAPLMEYLKKEYTFIEKSSRVLYFTGNGSADVAMQKCYRCICR
jgi:putative ABC transport system permease protein